ncbi:MAG: DDE-type integrase/transposase/recombinase [Chloroflexi bacterium]|nr:MAG: DDE-type integrase/transposase/recombinase [Chloroflexota bacterium]
MGNIAQLSEKECEEALRKYEKIRGYFEGGVSQAELARVHEMPLRTVESWVKRYREGGLMGLSRVRRADAGKRRGLEKDVIELVEGMYLKRPRPRIVSVYRKVCEVAKEQGWRVPSYSQVYRIVQGLSPSLVTLAHEGGDVYAEKYDLLYRWEAKRANEVWQADHCQLQIWLLNEQGRAAKPMLTIVLDDYSRCIAGYRLSWQAPSAAQTALTLRGAIWRKEDTRWPVQGIPESVYIDHGSDFTSRRVQALAADLKMALIFSQKGRPRGRGKVERFFRTVEQELLCDLPGYGPKVDWQHGEKRDEGCSALAQLSLAEFDVLFRKWLLETYHVRIQEGIGEPPLSRWKKENHTPRMPASLEELDVLLLTFPTKRQVKPDGISFQGRKYFDLGLAEYIGEEVIVRYDPANSQEITVYVPDGEDQPGAEYLRERFVCRAGTLSQTGEQITLSQVVEARSKRRKALRKELAAKEKKVQEYVSKEKESERLQRIVESVLPASSLEKEKDEVRLQEECAEQELPIKRFAHE